MIKTYEIGEETWDWDTETGKWNKLRERRTNGQLPHIPSPPIHMPSLEPENAWDLFLDPYVKPQWLIDGIWTEGARGFVAGNPGVGKTWFCLAMCLSVVTGRKFLDTYEIPNRGPCLLIEEETSKQNLKRRLDAMIKGIDLNEFECSCLGDFYHLTRKFIKIPENEIQLIELIKEKKIRLVVFDSLRRIHNRKEVSSDEMQPVLESLARIQYETNTNLILIHHLKKDTFQGSKSSVFERMRGTSDFWAWRDCIIGLEGDEESDKVKCVFQFRDDEEPASFCFVRESMPNDGILLRMERMENQETFKNVIARIREYLLVNPGASKSLVVENIAGKRKTKFEVLNWCIRKGMVEHLPSGECRWVESLSSQDYGN